MKLSERRKQEINEAVTKVIMDARVELRMRAKRTSANILRYDDIDTLMFKVQNEAGQAAIAAAEKARR